MIPQEILNKWPDCKIKGCKNKCCLRLKSEFCFPHTMGDLKIDDVIEYIEKQDKLEKAC